jgi:uncharacterized protein
MVDMAAISSPRKSNSVSQAVAQKLRVVHSSAGRLRVHLPDQEGHVSARLRRLPGIRFAEANELTGNILILFNPKQTSEKAVLAEIQPASLNSPAVAPSLPAPPEPLPAASVHLFDPEATELVLYVTGWRRPLYKFLGWTSVGLAVIGAITPGIPTAPFVLLASYFFIRSSPTAREWLLRSRWFGPILRDWEEHGGVRPNVKYAAMGLIGAGMVFTLLLGLPTAVVVTILTLEIIGLVIVQNLPVVEHSEPSLAPAPIA